MIDKKIIFQHLDNDDGIYDGDEYCVKSPKGMFQYYLIKRIRREIEMNVRKE